MSNLLYIDIVSSIESQIHNGELDEGSKLLSEREMANYYNVSRNVVREAIKVLKEKGYVDVQVGKGVFVTKPDPSVVFESLDRVIDNSTKAMMDILEVRAVIEIAIIKRAVYQANEPQIQQLIAAYQEMEENRYNIDKFIELDARFHMKLANTTKNTVFSILTQSLSQLMKRVISLTKFNPDSIHKAQEHHWEMIHAIKTKDEEAAIKVMRKHIEASREDIEIINRKTSERI